MKLFFRVLAFLSNSIRCLYINKTYYKWDDIHKNDFVHCLENDIQLLYTICEEDVLIDVTVNKFSDDRANPFFQKCATKRKENIFCSSNFSEKQKWFDNDYHLKKLKLREAVREYNNSKTAQNRNKVFACKKDYKYQCRKSKQKYNRERYRNMNEVRRKNLKQFWKIFKSRKYSPENNILDQAFYKYFKNLSSEIEESIPEDVINFIENFDIDERGTTFFNFDDPFSQTEIRKAINNLSSNKASGVDIIINEYFKNAADLLVEPIQILFNKILQTGVFPAQWATGLIVPIYKKGDADDTNNYRDITLISCFAKLFTAVISNPLKIWEQENEISTDAQFGFKTNQSTNDTFLY